MAGIGRVREWPAFSNPTKKENRLQMSDSNTIYI